MGFMALAGPVSRRRRPRAGSLQAYSLRPRADSDFGGGSGYNFPAAAEWAEASLRLPFSQMLNSIHRNFFVLILFSLTESVRMRKSILRGD
jgi:hypothetical protein